MLHIIKNYRELFLGLVETKLDKVGGATEADASVLNVDGWDANALNALLKGEFKKSHKEGHITIERKNTKEKVSTIQNTREQHQAFNLDLLKDLKKSSDYNERNKPLQRILIKKKMLKGSADGYFGPGTYKALRAYQAKIGANVTGIFDKDTFNKVKADLGIGQKVSNKVASKEKTRNVDQGVEKNKKTAERMIRQAREIYDFCREEPGAKENYNNTVKFWKGVMKTGVLATYDTVGTGVAIPVASVCDRRAAAGNPCNKVELKKEVVELKKAYIEYKEDPEKELDCSQASIWVKYFVPSHPCYIQPTIIPNEPGDGDGNRSDDASSSMAVGDATDDGGGNGDADDSDSGRN